MDAILYVAGMTCQHCAMKVKNAAEGVPGVVRAEIDLTEGEVHLTLSSPDVDMKAVEQAITATGYRVTG